jgi:hypothetical protein
MIWSSIDEGDAPVFNPKIFPGVHKNTQPPPENIFMTLKEACREVENLIFLFFH